MDNKSPENIKELMIRVIKGEDNFSEFERSLINKELELTTALIESTDKFLEELKNE